MHQILKKRTKRIVVKLVSANTNLQLFGVNGDKNESLELQGIDLSEATSD